MNEASTSLSEDDIDGLGPVLQKLIYADPSLRRYLQEKYGVTITRADFYSEIPTVKDIEASCSAPLLCERIFDDADMMIKTLKDLTKLSEEFDPPITPEHPAKYSWSHDQFSYSDAMAYYSLIRQRRPSTIIEVGSGASTLVALQACEKNGAGSVICVEPYPSEELADLPKITLVKKRVQDLPLSFFNDHLSNGDILFIDSTHTVKHDSDCLHLYLRIIPDISSDILIHAHDIFLPDPLPTHYMIDHQIFWNEQYLLYAYLLGNGSAKVIYGSHWHAKNNRKALDHFMHGRFPSGGASLWFDHYYSR